VNGSSKWWLGVAGALAVAAIVFVGSTLLRHEREIAILQTQMAQLLGSIDTKLDLLLHNP